MYVICIVSSFILLNADSCESFCHLFTTAICYYLQYVSVFMAAESASLLWSGVGPAEAAANVLRAPQHGPQVSCDWLAGLVLTSHWFTATPGQ